MSYKNRVSRKLGNFLEVTDRKILDPIRELEGLYIVVYAAGSGFWMFYSLCTYPPMLLLPFVPIGISKYRRYREEKRIEKDVMLRQGLFSPLSERVEEYKQELERQGVLKEDQKTKKH